LLRLAQMHPLRVEAIAPAAMFGKITPGMQAEVLAETHDGKAYVAEVAVVDRLIDPASGTFGIRLELPNSNYAIPSGLNCRLRINPQARVSAVPATKAMVAKVPAATAKPVAAKTAPKKAAPKKAAPKKAAPKPIVAKPVPRNVSVTTPTTGTLSCQTLGPFANEKHLNELLRTLGNDSREVGRRVELAQVQKGFFVLTETKNSVGDARSYGQSLKERGVGDLAVLTRAPHKGRLSLGLFSSRVNAEAHQLKMAKLRINTEVLPRMIQANRYWIDVELSATRLDQKPWTQITPEARHVGCASSDYVMADSLESE